MTDLTPLNRAVQAAGNISQLARKLGIAPQVCHRWVKRGWVPPKQALKLEVFYGIPAKELVNPLVREIADLLSS